MKGHVLLENAKRYIAPLTVPMPDNCTFEKKRGYWVDDDTGEALMLSRDPRKPKPQSKKMDIETGEDQKGE